MFLLLGLAASQALSDAVRDSSGPGAASAWGFAVFVQYLVCLALLVLFDHEPLLESLGPALVLTWFVRAYYFFKKP